MEPDTSSPAHPSGDIPLFGQARRRDPATFLAEWLIDRALPLWAGAGIDRVAGGFVEKLDASGEPIDEPRRTRVVARQIFVFATAARRKWLAGAEELVDHGLDFLLTRMRGDDGTFVASVRTDGTRVDERFDLYEQAFVLFALAAASACRPARAGALRGTAESLLEVLRRDHGHPLGGFREGAGKELRSNPHMHLLEAALAWQELSTGPDGDVWDALVTELVDLCLMYLREPGSGALTEYFDDEWLPVAGPRGRIVEPGHQFEWAWLLLRVASRAPRSDAASAAWRLIEIGEKYGVDPRRNVAYDVIDLDFQVIDTRAKLWPQTERLKAWRIAIDASPDAKAKAKAVAGFERAIRGLRPYLRTQPEGLWKEQMASNGTFVAQDVRASSLYHIVCAIDDAVPRVASSEFSAPVPDSTRGPFQSAPRARMP